MLQAIPDVTPFLSKGTLGAFVFLGVVAMIIAGFVTLKVVAILANRNNGNGKASGTLAGQQAQISLREAQAQRDTAQKQLDELKAGNKTVQFWLDAADSNAAKANQPVLRSQQELMQKMDQIMESQKRIRLRLKMEDDE